VIVAFQEETKDYMKELFEDFVEIVKSFSSRIYGHRSYKLRKGRYEGGGVSLNEPQ
jgi:predicted site-specific integrase-resolvase